MRENTVCFEARRETGDSRIGGPRARAAGAAALARGAGHEPGFAWLWARTVPDFPDLGAGAPTGDLLFARAFAGLAEAGGAAAGAGDADAGGGEEGAAAAGGADTEGATIAAACAEGADAAAGLVECAARRPRIERLATPTPAAPARSKERRRERGAGGGGASETSAGSGEGGANGEATGPLSPGSNSIGGASFERDAGASFERDAGASFERDAGASFERDAGASTSADKGAISGSNDGGASDGYSTVSRASIRTVSGMAEGGAAAMFALEGGGAGGATLSRSDDENCSLRWRCTSNAGSGALATGAAAGMAIDDAPSHRARRCFTQSLKRVFANADAADAAASLSPAALRTSAAIAAAFSQRSSGAAASAFAATATRPFTHGAFSGHVAAGSGAERTRTPAGSSPSAVRCRLSSISQRMTPRLKMSARASWPSPERISGARYGTEAASGSAPGARRATEWSTRATPSESEEQRRRRELAVRQLHRLLARVAQPVQRAHAGEDVEQHPQGDLERKPLRALGERPELAQLLAVEEIAEDDEVVAAQRDLAHARHVRVGERRDAARFAAQIGPGRVARAVRAGEALRHDDLRGAPADRRLARDEDREGARSELADHLVGSEDLGVEMDRRMRSHHVTETTSSRPGRIGIGAIKRRERAAIRT